MRPGSRGTNYSWIDATSSNNPSGAPLIDSNIFRWHNTLQTYNLISQLNPGSGYWLYSYQPCIVRKGVV